MLYDRLTHVYDILREGGRQLLALRDYHLNSGADLEKLRSLRVTEWNDKDVFLRDGRIVVP